MRVVNTEVVGTEITFYLFIVADPKNLSKIIRNYTVIYLVARRTISNFLCTAKKDEILILALL